MRTRLLGVLLALWMLAGLPASLQAQTPVQAILGGNLDCNQAFTFCHNVPSTGSLLCDGFGAILDCPQFFAPDWSDSTGARFFGLTNRTNPPRAIVSTDGGVTWGTTPTQPFVAALDGLGATFSVATDGSLIVVGDQGANNCIIRRSTDQGNTWSTVFTDATVNDTCGVAFGTPTPSVTRCASANPYCATIGRTSSGFNKWAVFSTDNGASWTRGTTFNITSGDDELSITVDSTGSKGSMNPYGVSFGVANFVFAYTSGGDWFVTGVIPTPPGAGTVCRGSSGSLMLGGNQGVWCGPDNVLTTTSHYFTHSGGTVVSTANSIVPSGLSTAQSPNNMAVGFDNSTAYFIGRDVLGTSINIWRTRDSFNSSSLLSTLTPATALISGCCRGDTAVRNGVVYFSIGGTGQNAVFGKIQ